MARHPTNTSNSNSNSTTANNSTRKRLGAPLPRALTSPSLLGISSRRISACVAVAAITALTFLYVRPSMESRAKMEQHEPLETPAPLQPLTGGENGFASSKLPFTFVTTERAKTKASFQFVRTSLRWLDDSKKGASLSVGEMTTFLLKASDATVAQFVDATMGLTAYEACFFECRPVRGPSDLFEFVLVDASRQFRNQRPSPASFSSHLSSVPRGDVTSFANLNGDALLVVPSFDDRVRSKTVYGHFAAFNRDAPTAQRVSFWRLVAACTDAELARRASTREPLWLSTSGLGVPWLHMRLDSTPKYYTFTEYTHPT